MQLFYKRKIVEINFILFKIKNPTRKNGIFYLIFDFALFRIVHFESIHESSSIISSYILLVVH